MLKIILNRLKPQAENIIAEEQAGFKAGRSITEQIFNLRTLCKKYFQHQQNLYYHVFRDFKKAFDWVWHVALKAITKKYNISADLIRVIKHLYDKATSTVLFNGSIEDWFRTTAEVRQGCLLSPTLLNKFPESIMTDAFTKALSALEAEQSITNLRFADDIDGLAGEEELTKLVERLDKASRAYGKEINAEKKHVDDK